jgi:uncharacterized coiled-coil protein SlyX
MKYLEQIKRITEIEEGIGTLTVMIAEHNEKIKLLKDAMSPLTEEVNKIYEEIKNDMIENGTKKAENDYVKVSIAKARKNVVIDDIDSLPLEFIKLKKEADKKLLAEALKLGVVAGAKLVDGEVKPKIEWIQ